MRPLPFAFLYLACLAGMLGGLFGARRALGAGAFVAVEPPPEEDAREPAMALPPKPQGASPDRAAAGEGPARHVTPESCEARTGELRDLCFQVLARQGAARDPQESARWCARVQDPALREECVADVAEGAAPVDRSASEALCATVASRKWRGQCHFGIGLALAEVDSAYALGRCEHAETFRDFCRHDVVGEVALVDVDAAVAFCAREEGDPITRKTCWHGIGKYLARRDASEAAAACARATLEWRGNCVHGAGWGAAERDVDAALAGCASLPAHADNCTQGVAHQQKRVDPARAVALCEGIATARIRARCLAFVRR